MGSGRALRCPYRWRPNASQGGSQRSAPHPSAPHTHNRRARRVAPEHAIAIRSPPRHCPVQLKRRARILGCRSSNRTLQATAPRRGCGQSRPACRETQPEPGRTREHAPGHLVRDRRGQQRGLGDRRTMPHDRGRALACCRRPRDGLRSTIRSSVWSGYSARSRTRAGHLGYPAGQNGRGTRSAQR
jgi:hypothetical protein